MEDFERIWREYARPLELWLCRLCGDASLAEEVAAESMLRALMNLSEFRGRSGIFTWLCAIGRNLLTDELRRRGRSCQTDELPDSDGGNDVAEAVCDRDQAKRIISELDRLGSPYREVFVYHALAGMSLAEIGRLNNKSESWARVTYYRAKAKIIEGMGETNEK